ncbi:P-loop containing nucleoside triphosphate hydrolase protein [Lophiotrema nucula]|uniref:P-loop containing nucleoside triphosphate hydrolase protein n=1 Tax=Lophiotrema nucula TaxID=690887 RepID=A0A6A5YSF7_9PLEO|nr:P-loop containing nucleoside triphosphate hydrolase protein [Lophiotrema nucula]
MTTDPPVRLVSRSNTAPLDASEPPDIKPDDIVIAVMGITGCGKTTFVNYFSDYPLVIGHSLDSCTQIVQVIPCTLGSGRKLYLVDTPGFDDQMRSDTDILREVALWLTAAHKMHIKLTGIIYLHRIMDVRVGGTGVRNIRMFKKLCGDDGLASVVLATTMWDLVPNEETGKKRETQLSQETYLWKTMIDSGSKVFRQDKGKSSATQLVEYLMSRKRPVVLDIQHEMVDQGLQLGQTGAGTEITSEVEKQKDFLDQKLKDLETQLQDALSKNDNDRKEELEEAKQEWEEKLSKGQEEIKKMQSNSEQLFEEMKKRYQAEMEEMSKLMHQKESAIQEAEVKMAMLEKTHVHEMELQEMKLKMKWKDNYYKMMYGRQCVVM